jgi:protein SCO1
MVGGILVAIAVVVFALTRGQEIAPGPLPEIGQVPEFSFTERSGRTVSREDLLGHIWVADFFFTSCTGPCPEMSLRMKSLQQSVINENLPVTLVSVSIDPEYDRPAVLKRYADKFGADPDRWLFLTGDDQKRVQALVRTGFLIGVKQATATAPIIHSTYFLLIDPAGRIRGVYQGLEPTTKRTLLADVRRLVIDGKGA